MKKTIQHYFLSTLLLCGICILANSTPIQAASNDPGAGRLSGKSISSDFYEETEMDIHLPIENYGSRKNTSPYTGVKYTHDTQFDDRTILHGIDVSKWQGEINWKKVKADGIDYAFIQVGYRGYGASGILSDATKDPYFDTNMQNAIAAGIKVGVYVFSQATTEDEAIEEAEYILDAIGNYSISMPLVMDFEYASTDNGLGGRLYNAKLSKTEATDICMAFCDEIDAAGFTPMIYANKSMLEDQIDASTLTDAGYRIWLANYTKNTGYSGTYDFWQYSEKGSVDGIQGDVDMNFYYVQAEDNFAPDPFSISSSVFTKVEDTLYTGNPVAPEILITHNGTPLTKDVDYTIAYSNNTNVGTATITITGIGSYCDVRKMHFNILPKHPSSLKAKKRTTNYITLSWKKDSSISGYEIYRATDINGTYTKIKTIKKKSTTTYKNTKLTAGKCYYYKIRSYKNVDGKTYYSEFTPVENMYTKTGYTRNATTKSKLTIYDMIPGTKKTTILVPDEEATTEQATTEEPVTETTTEATTEKPTTTEPSTEATTEKTESTEPPTEATTEKPESTEPPTEATTEKTESTEPPTETTTEKPESEEPPTEATTEKPETEKPPTEATTEKPEPEEPPTEATTEKPESQEPPTEVITTNVNNYSDTESNTTVNGTPMKEVTIDVDSTAIAEVSKKTKVNVIYSTTFNRKTWYYVSYETEDTTYKGFVDGNKVTVTKLGKVVKTKQVNVRKKATVYSKKLTTLKKNTKVDILKTTKKSGVTWYQVQFKKKNKTYKGWISAPYIKII